MFPSITPFIFESVPSSKVLSPFPNNIAIFPLGDMVPWLIKVPEFSTLTPISPSLTIVP